MVSVSRVLLPTLNQRDMKLPSPIAAVQNGDIISIDIPARKINVKLSDAEIKQRLKKVPLFKTSIKRGYLKRYIEQVGPASEGAVFKD